MKVQIDELGLVRLCSLLDQARFVIFTIGFSDVIQSGVSADYIGVIDQSLKVLDFDDATLLFVCDMRV